MAVEKTYTGDGLDKTFDITFPFLDSTDVKASIGGTTTSAYSITGTVLTFDTAPANGAAIRLYRNTNIATAKATFTAGASVKATDLNNVIKQLLYAVEEVGTVTANDEGLGLVAGSKGDIHVNTATDWVIKDNVVETAMLADISIDSAKIANSAVQEAKLATNAVTNTKIADNSVSTAKIQNNAITAAQIAGSVIGEDKLTAAAKAALAPPVGTVIWYAGSTAPTGYLKCNGDTIPDGTGAVQGVTADYSDLHNVIGSTLPDLRGEFIRGWDDSRGVDSGRSNRSTQSSQNKEHGHSATATVTDPGHTHTYVDQYNDGNGGYRWWKGGDDDCASRDINSGSNTTGVSVSVSVANNGGTEARPRNVALLACIKY